MPNAKPRKITEQWAPWKASCCKSLLNVARRKRRTIDIEHCRPRGIARHVRIKTLSTNRWQVPRCQQLVRRQQQTVKLYKILEVVWLHMKWRWYGGRITFRHVWIRFTGRRWVRTTCRRRCTTKCWTTNWGDWHLQRWKRSHEWSCYRTRGPSGGRVFTICLLPTGRGEMMVSWSAAPRQNSSAPSMSRQVADAINPDSFIHCRSSCTCWWKTADIILSWLGTGMLIPQRDSIKAGIHA